MDQRQKELLSSFASEIADTIKALELAELLELSKLVTKERIEDIMGKTDSNFCRNLRLIDAVQESNSTSAFDDFVKVLERIDPSAPKLLNPNSSKKKEREGIRSILGKMFNTFSKSPNGQYPLGMKCSLSTSSTPASYRSTSGSSNYQGDSATIISSPLKEKHQATLISSGGTSSSNVSPSANDGGFVLARRYPDGQLPVGPATPSSVSHKSGTNDGSSSHTNKFSQTPTRAQELTSINNLSLSEEADDNQSESGEPVISWHPYASSNLENTSRASSPHRCHPSYSSASSESGESSSDSLIVDPNLIMDSNVMTAIAREGPNMMSVKMATVCHNNPEEDYKMTARPRGKCLIVNNINFEAEIFPTRKGSDEDANRFDQIFKQLGFETIMTRNLTADQMREKFKELAAACKPEHDALFVFILSHGSEHGIYGTDCIEVYLESEIISCFDNRNCKAMLGKPKVFVIQACRGRAKDCGGEGDTTDSIAWPSVMASPTVRSASQENRVPTSWLPSQPLDGKKRKHPIRTDMLIVFSCLAGQYAGSVLELPGSEKSESLSGRMRFPLAR